MRGSLRCVAVALVAACAAAMDGEPIKSATTTSIPDGLDRMRDEARDETMAAVSGAWTSVKCALRPSACVNQDTHKDKKQCVERVGADGTKTCDATETPWPPKVNQLVVVDKGKAICTVVAVPDPEARSQRFTVRCEGSENKDKKLYLSQLKQYSGQYHPIVDDVVVQIKAKNSEVGGVGCFAKVVKYYKQDVRGIEYLEIEFSNGDTSKVKVAEVRKAVGDEPGRFEKAHAEDLDQPLCGAPVFPNVAGVSDEEVEKITKKIYEDLEKSKYRASLKTCKIYEGDKIILPTHYNMDALRTVLPIFDMGLTFASERERVATTRTRRKDAYWLALKQLSDADVVKIAKELSEEFDKLDDNVKDGGLKSERQKARERKAKGLEEDAQSREAIEAEDQIVMDDYYCADGHDDDGFYINCDLKERRYHTGNRRLAIGPSICLPRRASYNKELCDGATTALTVYEGGLEAFHEHLTRILFHPYSIRLFDERNFFIDSLTGGPSNALLCRTGTKGCNQIGPMLQYVFRSANTFWDDELGLASFDPDPTDEPHEATDRKIAALGKPLIANGLVRRHRTAGKHGRATFVWAGPVWAELEKLRPLDFEDVTGKQQHRRPLPFAKLAVAVISLGAQLGYPIRGATMFCAYGADALASMEDDLEAEERTARYAFADDWMKDVLDKCRAGDDCPSIMIWYRTQFASSCEIDGEYWPGGGVGWDLGVLAPECFEKPYLVVEGKACPKLLSFLTATANLAPGPGASRVTRTAVGDFLKSTRGTSSVLWAGQFEYSKNGGKRVTHRCPFPTKLAVVDMEVESEASDDEW